MIRDSPSRPATRSRSLDGIAFRYATEADLPECSRIHRIGIDDYITRMAFPPLPVENPGLLRLHAHTLASDPTRFQVAERRGRGGKPRIVAFGSAVERVKPGQLVAVRPIRGCGACRHCQRCQLFVPLMRPAHSLLLHRRNITMKNFLNAA